MKKFIWTLLIISSFGCSNQQTEILELIKDKYYLNTSSNQNKITTRIISNLEIDSLNITSLNNLDSLDYEFSNNRFSIRPLNFIKEPRAVKYNLTLYTNQGVRTLIDSFNVYRPNPVLSNLVFNYLYFNLPNPIDISVSAYSSKDIIMSSEDALIERHSSNTFIVTPNKLGKIRLIVSLLNQGNEDKLSVTEFYVIDKHPKELNKILRNVY